METLLHGSLEGPLTVQNNQAIENTPNNQTNQRNYSSVARSTPISAFPKKEQGIILGVIDGLRLSDYVIAVGNIIGPRHILFASRISNNRISIYLSSKEAAENFATNHPIIQINDHNVNVRRLLTPTRRIILSNVCPSIPHNTLENALRNLGFNLTSTTTFIRAGIPGDQYGHVLSFRRQVYVTPDDSIQLPSTILVNHEDLNYRIFLSYDQLACFICKAAGHIANQCPIQQTSPSTTQNEQSTSTTQSRETTHQHSENMPIDYEQELLQAPVPQQTTDIPNKRSASTILSSSAASQNDPVELLDLEEEWHTFKKPKNKSSSDRATKKIKRSESSDSETSISDQLEPLKTILQDSNPYPLNFDQLVLLFENSHGSPDPLSVAYGFTNDIPKLIHMLDSIHTHLPTRMKTKCTRLKKRINKQLEPNNLLLGLDTSDAETDSSQKGYM